jgi:hypothetical protein
MPKSAGTTEIRCSIWARNGGISVATLKDVKQEIWQEIGQLALKQKRLIGHCHMFLSNDLGAGQVEISRLIKDHLDAETKLGREIYPAARSENFTDEGRADDDCKRILGVIIQLLTQSLVCQKLEKESLICSANAKGLLDW